MINSMEIKYTINDICLKTSRMLKMPTPKILFNTNHNLAVFCEYGVNEIHINENLINDINNINNILNQLFKQIYFIYEVNVTNNFSNLESFEIVKLWKNELIQKLLHDDTSLLNLDIDISCSAFSVFMIEKIFNIKQNIENPKIFNKYLIFKSRYTDINLF